MSADIRLGSSFRDPSGFIFSHSGCLLRQINRCYGETFEKLNQSGLSEQLVRADLLIPYEVVDIKFALTPEAVAVIKPERVAFISYPYEWSFSQFKAAALATLQVQRMAIDKDMVLKDASAYNIQFHNGNPVLIDTLSFDTYTPGKPWVAYRQFCQHFLAPLVLMSHVDVRLSRLMATFIDGIPLDLASTICKPMTRFNAGIGMHLHLHAKLQAKAAHDERKAAPQGAFGKNALLGLVDSLQGLVEKLTWKPEGTEWANYYDETNYSETAMDEKHRLVSEFLDSVTPAPSMVWDLGANNGEFSALASKQGIPTVAWDIDPAAVEKNYRMRRGDSKMLPLFQDLTNPSPSIGWANQERDSLVQRGPVDVVMALALIHHLAIGNNVPLPDISKFLRRIGKWLIIEFVPKEDSQTQRLLAAREDVFPLYLPEEFESAFGTDFEIVRKSEIPGTKRTIYLLKARTN